MSVVVAVKKDDRIVIASDSQTSLGDQMFLDEHSIDKVIRTSSGSFIAFAGWGVFSNLLSIYSNKHPLKTTINCNEVFEYFVAFWKVLKEKYTFVRDQSENDSSPFADLNSTFLVVTSEKIFFIAEDLSVSEFREFYAIGSGSSYALGAVNALYETSFDAEEIADRAVRTAIKFDIGCGGSINIDEVE